MTAVWKTEPAGGKEELDYVLLNTLLREHSFVDFQIIQQKKPHCFKNVVSLL